MKLKIQNIIIIIIITLLGIIMQMSRVDTHTSEKTNEFVSNIEIAEGDRVDSNLLKNLSKEKVLIVEKEEEYLEQIKDNIIRTLIYMQKEYEVVSTSELASIELDEYMGVVLILESITDINNTNMLFEYVNSGGSIFFANRLENEAELELVYDKLGIVEFEGTTETQGIKLHGNLILQGDGETISDDVRLDTTASILEVDDKATVYITDEDDLPLLWSTKYGNGNIFYLNGSFLSEKANRGIISGVISKMDTVGIYPILNAKLTFIDDFPSPVPEGTSDEILDEYGLTIRDFYKNVWWKDMLEISSKYNVKYTAALIATYRDETKDLSDSDIDMDHRDFNYYTRELFLSGGELGVHGYNHQPLTTSELRDKTLGYNPWKDSQTMVEGIETALNFVKSQLNDYKIPSYIPPSNIISEEGIQALKDANPDFKILASLYVADSDSDSYVQEIEITEDGIFNLPRLTYNFEYADTTKWDLLSGVNLAGYISHFMHPDDILDSRRSNNKLWSQLSVEFNEMNSDIYNKYPWLQASTASEAAGHLGVYQNTDIYYEKNERYIKIYCDNFTNNVSFILRTENEIKSSEQCKVDKIDEGVYLVTANSKISKVSF